jgi:hypothetical protein
VGARLQHRPAQALQQFTPQPGLADAGLGRHQCQGGPALAGARCGQRLQRTQRLLAAHQRRGQALDAAQRRALGVVRDAAHQPGLQRRLDTLDLQGRLCLALEQPPHLQPGLVADAQAAHRRALFHARRQVHRVTHRSSIGLVPCTHQHRPGVHPDADARRLGRRQAGRGRAQQRAGCLQDLQPGPHRALGFVFMQAVGAEGGLQAVAGEAQHLAAGLTHHRGHALQQGVQPLGGFFGAQRLHPGRGAGHIGEQHADLAQPGLGRRWRGSRRGRRQLRRKRRNGGIDDGVAQQATSGLQFGHCGSDRRGVLHGPGLSPLGRDVTARPVLLDCFAGCIC